MKDFYDLLVLSRLFDFDGGTLASALRATFDRRGTIVPAEPPDGLSPEFADDENKQHQWTAFVRREPLLIAAPNLDETIPDIAEFAIPPILAVATGRAFNFGWADGGPWQAISPS